MKNLHQIREVSTLSFNERVLQEAEDERNPLMERLKFLGIFSSNMDEFFKVRVASIQRRIEMGEEEMGPVFEAVARKSRELDERFQAAYSKITRALAKEGIRILTEEQLAEQPDETVAWVRNYFHNRVLPSLVPILVQNDRPLPQLVDSALYFAVEMVGKRTRYAILEIPKSLPRFVALPNADIMYLDDVVRYSLHDIFSIFKFDRISAYEFKVSLDARLDMDNDFAEDYVRQMERVLQQRKGGRPTRLVYDAAMPQPLLMRLLDELKIGDEDTLIGGGRYHNMRDLMRFPSERSDLAFERMAVAPHPVLDRARRPMMDVLAERDILLTYPYQNFDHLTQLLREAAIDPDVRSIKITMYRAAADSQIVNALYNAARNGKRIFANIELQARFDEERNISIAEKLSEVGATVAYGVPPMKTHCKLILIRKKGGKLFAALSTGNFNEVTGRLYVDSALMTSNPQITEEVASVFTFLKQAARMRMLAPPKFKHLLVSPFNARRALYRLFNREKAKGADGYVLLKVNHLTDERILRRIRTAANAGVQMDLIVRTTYAMLPHKNIRAISILDRYLEHQRVYVFGRDKDRVVYMSSADLMERNIDWRVEAAFPIYDPALQQEVLDMMTIQVDDRFKARVLDKTQSNEYLDDGTGGLRAQYATHRFFEKQGQPEPREEAKAEAKAEEKPAAKGEKGDKKAEKKKKK